MIRRDRHRSARQAFTLIEVMMVAAIVGLLSSVAIFTITQVAQSNRERGAARGVAALIKRARAHALQEHALVSVVTTGSEVKLQVCPSRYGTNECVGLAAKTDLPNARVVLNNDAETLGVTLTAAPATALEFASNGFPTSPSLAPFTYTIDHAETPGSASVVVTAGGDVRVQ